MFSYFSLIFSHYTVLETKCVGNWKSEILWWAHHPVRETKLQYVAFIGPAYWIWDPLKPVKDPPVDKSTNRSGLPVLSVCRPIEVGCRFSKARPSINRSGPNILVTCGRKTVGWGGGGWLCITHAISINRRVWGFGLIVLNHLEN